METHKKIALGLFFAVVIYTSQRDGFGEALMGHLILVVFLIPILFYQTVAYFAGFGFPEFFARDFGSENSPGPYAFFFWILFLIASAFLVFEWSMY